MADARERTNQKQIQIDKLIKPYTILETIYKKANCSSYLVSVTMPDNTEETRYLQIYPTACAETFRQAEEMLALAFGQDSISSIHCSNGTHCLLIDLQDMLPLQWNEVLTQPLPQKMKLLSQIGAHLGELDSCGILLNGIDPRTFVHASEKSLLCWDFSNAILKEPATQKKVSSCQRKCAKDFARLLLQVLLGKAEPTADPMMQVQLVLLGQLPLRQQNLLLQLLQKAMQGDATLPALTRAVTQAAKSIKSHASKSKKCNSPFLETANFLQKHPLWKYVREVDGEKQLNILMVGTSPMREAFLDAILPCAQMLDTQMHIHILSKDAPSFCDKYLKKAPLLAQAVQITHIPERPKKTYVLNKEITGKDIHGNVAPLACLTFEKATSLDWETMQNYGCILSMGAMGTELRTGLIKLAAQTSAPLLIGVRDALPQETEIRSSSVALDSFCTGQEEDVKNTPIYKQALNVHAFYEKSGNELATKDEIEKSFQKEYNQNSSIRAALSIPYKLAAYGLADCDGAADLFCNKVLKDKNRTPMRRLIWLEHRSWQAHLMVNGWNLNTETFKEDFNSNGYERRNDSKKWHACLFGSNDADRKSANLWDKSVQSLLDPLDKMSVTLHGLLEKHIKGEVNHQIERRLGNLEKALPAPSYQRLQHAVSAQQLNHTNANVGWARVIKALEKDVLKIKDTNTKANADIWIADLKSHIRFVEARNAQRDYKNTDRDLIEAIPFLLEKDSIKHIYKLWSGESHPWCNAASAFFLEPETLTLVTDERKAAEAQKAILLEFLQNRRKIAVNIEVLSSDEMKKLPEGAVLDVSGASPKQIVTAMRNLFGAVETIPMIHYENGRIDATNGTLPLVRFYRCNQSLKVADMMALTGTVVLNENQVAAMHKMENAADFWEKAKQIHDYNTICNFLSSSLQERTYNVYPEKYGKAKLWDIPLTKQEAEARGLSALLNSLQNKHIIKSVNWINKKVEAQDPLCQKSLNKMLTKYDEAGTGAKDMWRLTFHTDSPTAVCALERIDMTVDVKYPIEGSGGNRKIVIATREKPYEVNWAMLKAGLLAMKEEGWIQAVTDNTPLWTKDTIATEKNQEEALRFQFKYKDLPTMDCLTKAGNALEALAYHTLRGMYIFDDVKLGVSIRWNEDAVKGVPTNNEIDLVCTKGTRSFFISCKKKPKIDKEFITEICYETDRFGIHGTPILLTIAKEDDNREVYARARRMGVEIITLDDRNKNENSAEILKNRINEILEKYCK